MINSPIYQDINALRGRMYYYYYSTSKPGAFCAFYDGAVNDLITLVSRIDQRIRGN